MSQPRRCTRYCEVRSTAQGKENMWGTRMEEYAIYKYESDSYNVLYIQAPDVRGFCYTSNLTTPCSVVLIHAPMRNSVKRKLFSLF
jgi:hypothetical protein